MKIGSFDLDKDGVFIVAELSANHNGNLQIALDTIKAAKEAGANAIKLQTYTADTMTLNSDKEDFIINQGTLWDGKSFYELYKEAYTPWEWHQKLFDYARSLDIDIFSTPFDKSAVDFLEQFNPTAYKLASFEVTDYELVRYMASKQKPMIMSIGLATMDEINDIIQICKNEGNNEIIILKCTSAYPASYKEANLKTIPNIAETFGVEVGFSDHTLGTTAPIVAVSLGAKMIEKHFILDRSIGGADAAFSLNKDEFTQLVKAVRDTEKLLGNVDYSSFLNMKKNRAFTRSLYVSKPIKKGEIFTEDNIRCVRPGYGLHPKYLKEILGKKASCDIDFAQRLKHEYIK